jgi:hypothetical protein
MTRIFYGLHEFLYRETLGVLAYMFGYSGVKIFVSLLSVWPTEDVGVRKDWAEEFLDPGPTHQLLCNESFNQVAALVRKPEIKQKNNLLVSLSTRLAQRRVQVQPVDHVGLFVVVRCQYQVINDIFQRL